MEVRSTEAARNHSAPQRGIRARGQRGGRMTRFSIALHESGPLATISGIRLADEVGVGAVWLTSGSAEQMTILAAAAVQTRRVGLGTAVVPTYPRHPLVLAQQAAVLHALAPGRFRLGVGPSHQPLMEDMYGLPFQRPLSHLKEYVAVLRQALGEGKADFQGEHFRVKMPAAAAPVPILVSALRERSFALAGEISEGGIAWICPAPYLRERALPALQEGARRAGRPRPPLIAHAFLCVTPDQALAREDARKRLQMYPKLPFYAAMLRASGDEEAGQGAVTDRLIDAVVACGDASRCADWLRKFAETSGADEVIASLMSVGESRVADLEAGMRVVAALSAQ